MSDETSKSGVTDITTGASAANKADQGTGGARPRNERWVRLVLLVAAAAIVALVVSQLFAEPDGRSSTEPVPVPDTPTAPPSPQPLPTPAVTRLDAQPQDHIVSDGSGGFVGVRSAIDDEAALVFSSSTDGQGWEPIARWDIPPDRQVTDFERSANHFIVWIDDATNDTSAVSRRVALSSDLTNWSWRTIRAVLEPPPFGLFYEHAVTGVSVKGDTVLALITLNVEINFSALQLVEGNTCGHSIERTEVIVKLCNDSTLDVLAIVDIDELPPSHQLVVSRNGGPFEPVDAPFADRANVQLRTTNDAFTLADAAGARFASSTDGSTWQDIEGSAPGFLDVAEVNEAGRLVGVGRLATDELVIINEWPGPTVFLDDLIDATSRNTRAAIASYGATWALWIQDDDSGQGWLLYSSTGQQWELVQAMTGPRPGLPRLIAGETHIILHSVSEESVSTSIIPVP